jgi:hypothetical protein
LEVRGERSKEKGQKLKAIAESKWISAQVMAQSFKSRPGSLKQGRKLGDGKGALRLIGVVSAYRRNGYYAVEVGFSFTRVIIPPDKQDKEYICRLCQH